MRSMKPNFIPYRLFWFYPILLEGKYFFSQWYFIALLWIHQKKTIWQFNKEKERRKFIAFFRNSSLAKKRLKKRHSCFLLNFLDGRILWNFSRAQFANFSVVAKHSLAPSKAKTKFAAKFHMLYFIKKHFLFAATNI